MPAATLSVLALAGAAISWTVDQPAGVGEPDRSVASPVAPVASSAPVAGPAAVTTGSTGADRDPAPVGARRKRPSVRPTDLPAAGVPRQVLIDSLGIEAPVLSVVSEGQSLDPPPDPQVLGWWAGGARAGAPRGTALVTGHTVHDGGGALDDLEGLPVGADIRVRTDRGTIRYVVESVAVLDKDTIARQAPQLFSQDVHGRLVLVTCEDWDGTGYRSNVVVTATPS